MLAFRTQELRVYSAQHYIRNCCVRNLDGPSGSHWIVYQLSNCFGAFETFFNVFLVLIKLVLN